MHSEKRYLMKRTNKNERKHTRKQEDEHDTGILVISDKSGSELYRYASSSQRKIILREHINDKCKEFKTEEFTKAEEYRSRMDKEIQSRKYPLGYIAVRSGRDRGVYPYINPEERLKIMNKFHKYEIRDFDHYLFKRNAEEWSEFGSGEKNDGSSLYTGKRKLLKRLFQDGVPAKFSGIVKSIESGYIFFEELEVSYNNYTESEYNITIYNPVLNLKIETGQNIQFYAEVCKYLDEHNKTEYGIYNLFDLSIL